MNCPRCQVALAITDRQGIEIDYCPRCRGVWLDRGELDKILERSTQYDARRHDDDDDDDDDRRKYRPQPGYPPQQGYPPQPGHDPRYHPQHKRKSFWQELFD